jgi:hypothetical protein
MTSRDRVIAIAFVVLVIVVLILAAVFHGPGDVDNATQGAAKARSTASANAAIDANSRS